jgi:hypothetical protein
LRLCTQINRAIVINSFGRSGSNILANMIGSSPSILMIINEFWQFYYNGINFPPKVYRRLGIAPGKCVSRMMFSGTRFRARLGDSIRESCETDYQLRKERGISFDPVTTLLFKVTEYDIFLNREIEKMFDRAIFIGLIRNGYGLCESWKRRGMPAKMAGKVYNQIAGQMIEEQNSRRDYMLVRFEDLAFNPLAVLDRLYERLALSLPHEDSYIYRPKGFGPGQETASSGVRRMRTVHRSYWQSLLARDINAAAIERLTREDFEDFNRHGSEVMQKLYESRSK